MGEYTAYCTGSAYVDENYPSGNFSTGEIFTLSSTQIAFFQYAVPEQAQKERVITARFYIYVDPRSALDSFTINANSKSFGEKTITYLNRPSVYNITDQQRLLISGTAAQWANVLVDNTYYLTWATYALANGIQTQIPNLDLYTSRASNRPYVQLITEPVAIYAAGLSPVSGFINEKTSNVFQWSMSYNDSRVIGKINQTSAKIEWRVVESSTINTINISGSASSYTIPANTFPNGNIEWRITATGDNGATSAPSAWYQLTTIDTTTTAIVLSPVDDYVDSGNTTLFSWESVSSVGSTPTAFEIEVNSAGSWETLVPKQVSSASQYLAPANTLPTGKLMWRVRTYNTDDAPGEWSDPANIFVMGSPNKPEIQSVTAGTARPTIQWISVGQQGFQLQVLDSSEVLVDTDVVYGTDNKYKIPYFLNDGIYTMKLRIQNSYGLFSDWTEYQLPISTVKPEAASFSAAVEDGYISITVTSIPASTDKLYLLRNGTPIAKIGANLSYDDYAAYGKETYQIRTVDEQDAFSDSEEQAVEITVPNLMIGSTKKPDRIINLKLNKGDYPGRENEIAVSGQFTHYVGRNLPVCESSGFYDGTRTFTFSFLNKEDLAYFNSLVKSGDMLLVRDPIFGKSYGACTSFSYAENKMSADFSMSIYQVGFQESIDYDG